MLCAYSCEVFSASLTCLRSETSRKTNTTPTIFPTSSVIGDALSSTGISFPSREISVSWFFSTAVILFFRIWSTGFVKLSFVDFSAVRNTFSQSSPSTSFIFQPVRFSAVVFINFIVPDVSIEMTASPMLRSVVPYQVSFFLNFRSNSLLYRAISIVVWSSRSSNGLRMYPNGSVLLARLSVSSSAYALRNTTAIPYWNRSAEAVSIPSIPPFKRTFINTKSADVAIAFLTASSPVETMPTMLYPRFINRCWISFATMFSSSTINILGFIIASATLL